MITSMKTISGKDFYTEVNFAIEHLTEAISKAVSAGATHIVFTAPQCGVEDDERVTIVFRRNETEEETKTRWAEHCESRRKEELKQLAYLKKKYEGEANDTKEI